MQIIITGKNMEVTDWLRDYVEKKVNKLDRYLPDASEARVELSALNRKSASDRHVVQLTLRSDRTILRAEERAEDITAAFDSVVDKMHRQISRYKGKRGHARARRLGGISAEDMLQIPEEEEEEEGAAIVRVKRFPMMPMTEDEAIEQMELLGHNFFIFYHADHGEVNVVYRRRDGNYGLLQPELV